MIGTAYVTNRNGSCTMYSLADYTILAERVRKCRRQGLRMMAKATDGRIIGEVDKSTEWKWWHESE